MTINRFVSLAYQGEIKMAECQIHRGRGGFFWVKRWGLDQGGGLISISLMFTSKQEKSCLSFQPHQLIVAQILQQVHLLGLQGRTSEGTNRAAAAVFGGEELAMDPAVLREIARSTQGPQAARTQWLAERFRTLLDRPLRTLTCSTAHGRGREGPAPEHRR
jgi:hypothetical protein